LIISAVSQELQWIFSAQEMHQQMASRCYAVRIYVHIDVIGDGISVCLVRITPTQTAWSGRMMMVTVSGKIPVFSTTTEFYTRKPYP
jgi:hypothetical protein